MTTLDARYIVVHTAAYSGKNCDADRIDQWHRERGWQGIGYHYVIINDRHEHLDDGTVQLGREVTIPGAHARGLNSSSIGICCVGHGDRDPLTPAQTASLVELISSLIDEYAGITTDRVIGHREINKLITKGEISDRYQTHKTCPGMLVSMDEIRHAVEQYRTTEPRLDGANKSLPPPKQLKEALAVLEASSRRFPNASEPLREFLSHPEVVEFLERN